MYTTKFSQAPGKNKRITNTTRKVYANTSIKTETSHAIKRLTESLGRIDLSMYLYNKKAGTSETRMINRMASDFSFSFMWPSYLTQFNKENLASPSKNRATEVLIFAD
jgi:hypothetical protein